ncbi:hypothetical protein IWQ56_000766 [Coemansia nantahalensis]|uniref:Uncharacterized protein n=1 Tax=Coemansia helicoidea TaxID=1286919 RepID=A0ACC1L6Z5_9FUNG|nr:hypothetical protein IWQ56_000766 [Coemansia nantahalensis]KAJ2802531.1 hypothetical protein H4R21_002386 [Coemansia helicoidea]
MKFTALSAGLAAISSLFAAAAAAPVLSETTTTPNINYTCAFRVTYQLLGHLNTGDDKGGWGQCGSNNNAGYMAGFARFTTRWGSALAVVDEYKASPHYQNEFDALYDALKTAAKDQSPSVEKLDGFCEAWTKAMANGNYLVLSQIDVARKLFDLPTRTHLKTYGIKLPLTRAALVYTAMANGLSDTDAGLGAVIKKTNAKFTANVAGKSGNSVKVGDFEVDEAVWLGKFLDVSDDLTNKVHSLMDDVFRRLIKDKQFTLSSTLKFKGLGDKQLTFTCNKLTSLTDSED